jgi:hypothetical protein
LSEIENRIRECIAQIKHYRSYPLTLTDQMTYALKEIENLIGNLNSENIEKALEIVTRLDRQLSTEWYSGYIGTTLDNLKFIREWLEKAKQ